MYKRPRCCGQEDVIVSVNASVDQTSRLSVRSRLTAAFLASSGTLLATPRWDSDFSVRSISFDCCSVAKIMFYAGDWQMVLGERGWRSCLNAQRLSKLPKRRPPSTLAILRSFLQSFYCPKQRCETCSTKGGRFDGLMRRVREGAGCSLIVRRFRWFTGSLLPGWGSRIQQSPSSDWRCIHCMGRRSECIPCAELGFGVA